MANAVFVDCTPELKKVIEEQRLPIPDTVRVHEENPTPELLIAMAKDAEALYVEHTKIPP